MNNELLQELLDADEGELSEEDKDFVEECAMKQKLSKEDTERLNELKSKMILGE